MDYHPFVGLEILDKIRSIRGPRRKEISEFLRSLKLDPFQKGDFQKVVRGREAEVKVFGKYSVYYWADHPVREVKIIELLKSDK